MNLKISSALITSILFFGPNTPQEKTKEWEQLFNGKDLTGWTAKIYPEEILLAYSKLHFDGPIVYNYNPQIMVDDTALKSGYITFQSVGQPVEFRNIYLKDLSKKNKNVSIQRKSIRNT